MPFIHASTDRISGISSPGRGPVIAPASGGSVAAQIERSTHVIAARLGCSPSTIQKLAGIEPESGTTSARTALSSSQSPPTSGRSHHHHQQQQQPQRSPHHDAKLRIEGGNNSHLLPPLPAHVTHSGRQPSAMESGDAHHNSATGGLTIAQQQAAFLDDAEAARQFAAQLRFRHAMEEQRRAPGVGQYEIPAITGADRSSIFSRAPHVSLDGQTPRSGRFVFNMDLFENGLKRPGPGEYFSNSSSARYHKTVAGRDRGQRKRLPIERVNPHMPVQPKANNKQWSGGGGGGGAISARKKHRSGVVQFEEM